MTSSWFDDIKDGIRSDAMWRLIALNLLVFVIGGLVKVLGFMFNNLQLWQWIHEHLQVPASFHQLLYQPWSIITYMFYHEGVMHLLGNMLFLFVFAQVYQLYMNNDRLSALYLAGGIAGALLFMLSYQIFPAFYAVRNSALMAGASASIFAIMFAATTLHPDHELNLLLIGRVPIKYVTVGLLLLDIVQIPYGNAGGYLAHCGGAFTGWLFVSQLRQGRNILRPFEWIGYLMQRPNPGGGNQQKRTRQSFAKAKSTDDQARLDAILDKISTSGYESLSKDDKDFLFQYSKK
ncbi:MAG: rhomboid family intramembrane serine protease [Chitinophagales bacterium]